MEDEERDLLNELREAAHEIRRLRHDNDLLAARVQTMELLGQFLHAQLPRQSEGAVLDIAWALDRRAQRIEDKPLMAAKERASRREE